MDQHIKKGDEASTKKAFLSGVVGGILVLCTIGFFILLGFFLSGNTSSGNVVKDSGTAAQPTVPVPQGSGKITLAEVTDKDWYKGGKNADITIVEFSDTECPFCKRFHNTMNQIIDEYGDKVKWVYRHAPLTSLHRKAVKEAEALECAGELGGNKGFWKYADRLFEITPSNDGLAALQFPEIAEYAGLNRKKFETCLDSGKHKQKVMDQLRDAETAGLRGTPYSILIAGDEKIPINGAQPYEQVKTVIDAFLQS